MSRQISAAQDRPSAADATLEALQDAPKIRNMWAKNALRRVRTLPPQVRDGILSQLDPELIATVRATRDLGFITALDAVRVTDAIASVIGRDSAVDFWKVLVSESYAGGVFSQLLLSAFRLGSDGTRLLRLAPQAWELASINCGHVSVTHDGDVMVIESVGFPPAIRDSEGFAAVFFGALLAMQELGKHQGTIRVAPSEGGELRFHVHAAGSETAV